jgi:hypothetical protein
MASVHVSVLGGVSLRLEHGEIDNVLSDVGSIGPKVVAVAGPALGVAGVAAPLAALVTAVLAVYLAAQMVLIKRLDRGYGVDLNLPWPAIWFQQWFLIIPTTVSPPGVGVCPAGGQHEYVDSSDYALVMDEPAAPGQHEWRWCDKCGSLNHGDGLNESGRCPAGGSHRRQNSSDYALVIDDPNAPGQHSWRWCDKCASLNFGDGPNAGGRCPAGGSHRRENSSDYALVMDQPDAAGQHGWRWCHKCSTLIFAGA